MASSSSLTMRLFGIIHTAMNNRSCATCGFCKMILSNDDFQVLWVKVSLCSIASCGLRSYTCETSDLNCWRYLEISMLFPATKVAAHETASCKFPNVSTSSRESDCSSSDYSGVFDCSSSSLSVLLRGKTIISVSHLLFFMLLRCFFVVKDTVPTELRGMKRDE